MTEERGYRFLCGTDMVPGAVLAAFPGAQFVARAQVMDTERTETEPNVPPVWGILVQVPANDDDRSSGSVAVRTDDGRVVQAVAPAGTRPTGDPAAVLAAARYWELPPAYVATLSTSSFDPNDGTDDAISLVVTP